MRENVTLHLLTYLMGGQELTKYRARLLHEVWLEWLFEQLIQGAKIPAK